MHLEIDDEALAEALEGATTMRHCETNWAREFAEHLDRAVTRMLANPMMWPPHTRRTRRYLMDRFPYAVIYRVKGDALRILAVSHQHRRPGYWTRRLGKG